MSENQQIDLQQIMQHRASPWTKLIQIVVTTANIVAAIAMGVEGAIRLYSYVLSMRERVKKRTMGFAATKKPRDKPIKRGTDVDIYRYCPTCMKMVKAVALSSMSGPETSPTERVCIECHTKLSKE
ncbi:MAG: hypothetical protein GF334_06695 [Candidatus Altiarchaeales archaeon]|nr:hypothetical protein [Candidatus Altiarchaeales archaeon]